MLTDVVIDVRSRLLRWQDLTFILMRLARYRLALIYPLGGSGSIECTMLPSSRCKRYMYAPKPYRKVHISIRTL